MYDMIKTQLNAALPFVSHNGIEVTEVADGAGTAVFKETPNSLNHIGSQHAGGLFTVGEAASGAAMSGAFASVILNVLPLASGAEIKYFKVAKGDITALAKTSTPGQELLAALEKDGVAKFKVDVLLHNADGETIGEMVVLWNVRKRR